ncbi:MAG: GxxExxY protein [Armatimonadota bacterium]
MEHEGNAKERDPQTYAIIGAAIEVHKTLGAGFLEAVYQEALAIELQRRGIPFKREVSLPIFYKGTTLSCAYRADFVCFEDIVLELAEDALTSTDQAQVLNYLKATGFERGLLLNFGAPSLERKRLYLTGPHRTEDFEDTFPIDSLKRRER